MSKYKASLARSAVIITIILLSVASGLVCQYIFHTLDIREYPRDYAELVSKYANEYGVPEYVVYGVIKYESDCISSAVGEDGGVGLMGVRAEELDALLRITKENLTSDALYGPETNIRYGTNYLSQLYTTFGSWDGVIAAKIAGIEESNSWLEDSANLDEAGLFKSVPQGEAAEEAEKCMEYVQKYRTLYYSVLSE